jgi:mRNA interferase RelE/StbE
LFGTDDYYKLENVATYYSSKESFHRDPKAMESLLKMPVFAHLYYLKTVEAPFTVADTEFNEYEQELLKTGKIKKLQGMDEELYRLRLRTYRVIYKKEEDRQWLALIALIWLIAPT